MDPSKCKDDQVLNPLTKRCININGAVFQKLDKSLLLPQDKEKLAKIKNKQTSEAKTKSKPKKYEEVKNKKPNTETKIKDTKKIRIVKKREKPQVKVSEPKLNIEYLYSIAKTAGKLLLDPFVQKDNDLVLYHIMILKENLESSSDGKHILSLNHPKTNESISSILDRNNTNIKVSLLECFVYYYVKYFGSELQQKYQVNKTKIIFTECDRLRLYFRHRNSRNDKTNKLHFVQIKNTGLTSKEIQDSNIIKEKNCRKNNSYYHA